MDNKEKTILDDILVKYRDTTDPELIILQAVQQQLGYVGQEYLIYISETTRLPLSRLYGIVTFYPQLKLNPPGRNTIRVCQGTACHVRGGARVLVEVERILGIKPDETTDDRCFSMESVRCLGCCGLSPVIMINDETYGRVNPMKLKEIFSEYE